MMNRRTRLLVTLFSLLAVGGAALAWSIFGDLPPLSALEEGLAIPTVRITDREGRLLYDIVDAEYGRQMGLPLEQIPLRLQQATIATEDKNFYRNPGVDLEGVVRAFWINLRGREVLAGGSTITQQLSRNLLLDAGERGERTVRRKVRESWLAWRLARELEKEEILALYLNQIYYGGRAYGVEAAAQTFFAKSTADLTLAESALLAGLPQLPALYNPFVDPGAAKERQQVVLDLMRKEGMITQAEYDLALREPLQYATMPYPVKAPHFVMMVQAQLDTMFTQAQIVEGGGLTVRTTLDLNWQAHAEEIVGEHLFRLNHPLDGGPGHNVRNGALVALDPHSGDILTLVGNGSYFDESIAGAINMATSPRQPGSALKPVVYAGAISPDQSPPWTAASMIPDVRTVFETDDGEVYVPSNFSRSEHGPVLLRQALASSLNIPAVRILDAIGVETAIDLAAELGLVVAGNPEDVDLAYSLGGVPVPLLDVVAGYGAFANGGSRISPRLILDVAELSGKHLFSARAPELVQVIDERVAWLISDILSDNDARRLSFGPNSILKLDRPAAVKTGTSNSFRDNWTVGYTPELAVGVWVGNADNEPMRDVTGVSGAGPIWHHFMRTALAGAPASIFRQPPGLVQTEICALSGLLPTEACPYRRQEWFLAGTQPTLPDTFFHKVRLDSRSGRLAGESTPPEHSVERLALDLPVELHPWARLEGMTLLDDLLMEERAAGRDGDAATEVVLQLLYPDPHAIFRLSPSLPAEAQQLRFEAVAGAAISQVSLWLDGAQLASFSEPPFEAWWPLAPGQHTAWAEGRDGAGAHVATEKTHFEVRDVRGD